MTRWAALPRAINAGKPLAMADLRALVERCGGEDVATLLASGNVVFGADADAAGLEARLQGRAREDLGLETDWFVRSHQDLAALVAGNPFADAAQLRPNWLAVHFFAAPIDAAPLVAHVGVERWRASNRELYVDYAQGMGRSKLAPRLGRLAPNTARNWNTVLKLVAATA